MNSAPLSFRKRACGIEPRRAQRQLESIAEEHLVRGQKTIEAKLPDHTKSTYAIAFSACGKYCATSTGDHNVHIIERATGKLVKTLTGHPRTCWSVVFHPKNPKLIASADLSGEVRVWCVDTGEGPVWRRVRGVVERETNRVSVCFHPRDNVLAIGISNELHLWDWWEDFKPFVSLKTGSDAEKILFCRFSPDGKQLITAISSAPETASPQPLEPFQDPFTTGEIFIPNSRTHDSAKENQGQQPSTSNTADVNSRTRDTSPLRVNSPRNSRISPFHRRHNRPNQNQNPLGQQPFSLTAPGASVAPGDWGATVPPASLTYGHLEDLTSDSQDRIIPGANIPNSIFPFTGNSRTIPFSVRSDPLNPGSDVGVSIEQLIGSRTLQRAYVREFMFATQLQYERQNRPREEKKKLCRLQLWDFDPLNLPEISLPNVGHLLSRVKLNNDSSVSIAKDFSQIACFVQEQSGREHHYSSIFSKLTLVVVSLRPNNLGDTLWSRNFGNDALCVSISPLNNYLAIGMKVRRMSFPPRNVPLIEFYSMKDEVSAVSTMTADLSANFNSRNCQFVVNTIAFMPTPGQGLLYGTSTGKLCLVVPDLAKENSTETEDSLTERERLEQSSRNRDNLRARLRSAQRQASIRNTTSYLRLGENTVSVTPAYSSTRSRAIFDYRLDSARGILRRTTQDPLLSSSSITEYRPVTVQLQSAPNGANEQTSQAAPPPTSSRRPVSLPPQTSQSRAPTESAVLLRSIQDLNNFINRTAQTHSPMASHLRTRRRSAASSRAGRAMRLKRRQDLETQISGTQRDASTNTDSSQTSSAESSRIASRDSSSIAPFTRQSARLRRESARQTITGAVQQNRSRVFRLSEQLAALDQPQSATRRDRSATTVSGNNEPVNSLDIQALQRDLMEQRAQLARQHAILVEHQRINSRLRRRVDYQERVELRRARLTDNARSNMSSLFTDQALSDHPPPPPSTVPPHALASVIEVPEVREEDVSQAVALPNSAQILAPDVHLRLLEIENALNVPTSSASSNPTQPSSHDD